MTSDTKMSKPQGLKDREKAQKDMAKAKRAAAAARQAKSRKGSKVEKKVKAVVVQEPVAEDTVQHTATSPAEKVAQEEVEIVVVQEPVSKDTVTLPVDEVSQEKPVIAVVLVAQDTSMVAEKIAEDVSENIAIPTINNVEAPSSSTISQEAKDAAHATVTQDELAAKAAATAAHRKKLEADLYDNMESGRQCFARLHGIAQINRMTSATAEYHYKVVDAVDDDAVFDYSLANADEPKRAADDTGIEYVAAAHDAAAHTPEDAIVPESTDVIVDEVAAAASNEPETATKSITWAQLLFSTTNAGASTGSAPRAKSPLTLAEVEKMQAKAKAASETSQSRAVDIEQLFAADKAERTITVRMPEAVEALTVPEITDLFAAEGAPAVRLPPARDWSSALAGMTFTCLDEIADDESPVEHVITGGRSRTPVDRKLVEAVIFGRPEELGDVSEVPSPALEGNSDDKPVLDVLQLGAEKLMSMLGVDGHVATAAPTQQNGQDGAGQIMALLGIPRPRTTSGSTVPTPSQLSPVMTGGQSTPNTNLTVTPPPLDDGLAKPNTHNVSNNDCGAGQIPAMTAASAPYGYQNLGVGPQYPAAQYVADPFFHGYHPHGLPGFPTPFYGQW